MQVSGVRHAALDAATAPTKGEILHLDLQEVEIAYLGLLEDYHNKKLGGHLLFNAIKKSFEKKNIKRVWVHTCTLDHKNALKNYLARGMKIYKKETIEI